MEVEKDVALEAVENYKVYVDQYSKTLTLEEYWAHTGKTKNSFVVILMGQAKMQVSKIG